MALEVLRAHDVLVPDDEVEINRYDPLGGAYLIAPALALPVLEIFDDAVVVVRGGAVDDGVEIWLVLAVAGRGFVDRRHGAFMEIGADMLYRVFYLVFSVGSVAPETDCTRVFLIHQIKRLFTVGHLLM